MTTVSINEFINNSAGFALINIQHYITAENLTNNVLIDNKAAFDIYIDPSCSLRPNLSGLSLGVLVVFNALKTGVEI